MFNVYVSVKLNSTIEKRHNNNTVTLKMSNHRLHVDRKLIIGVFKSKIFENGSRTLPQTLFYLNFKKNNRFSICKAICKPV